MRPDGEIMTVERRLHRGNRGNERFELAPGMMARVGPAQLRKIVPGPKGIRFVAIGGTTGRAFVPSAWSELGPPRRRCRGSSLPVR